MKFQFKIQPFQTDAVNSTVKIFSGQPYTERLSYVRDLGITKRSQGTQPTLFVDPGIPENDNAIGFEKARPYISAHLQLDSQAM